MTKPNTANTHCASKVYSFSEETLFATFDAPTSDFAVPDQHLGLVINEVRVENKTISVIRGERGTSVTKLTVERPLYLPNQTIIVRLSVSNPGDTDIHTSVGLLATVDLNQVSDVDALEPAYRIVSLNRLRYASYPYDHLVLFNNDGPGGIVQARSTISVRLEIRPANATILGYFPIRFYDYNSQSEDFLHEFLAAKIDNYRIRGTSDHSWSILAKFIVNKARSRDVQRQLLYETINELSAHNIKVYRLDELISYHINRIDGAFLQGFYLFQFF